MTTLTRTLASARIDLPAYSEYDVVLIDSAGWRIVFVDDFTEEEKDAIENKLDTEDAEPKLTFSSAKEAIDFLRSRLKHPHA